MPAHLLLIEMTNRTHLNVGGFHGSKRLFDIFQIFIAVTQRFGRLAFLFAVGTNDVTTDGAGCRSPIA